MAVPGRRDRLAQPFNDAGKSERLLLDRLGEEVAGVDLVRARRVDVVADHVDLQDSDNRCGLGWPFVLAYALLPTMPSFRR